MPKKKKEPKLIVVKKEESKKEQSEDLEQEPETALVKNNIEDNEEMTDGGIVKHSTEEEARNSVYQGTVDLQTALFRHASFTGSRLGRVRPLIAKIETRIFEDDFLVDLDKKELLKIYELIKSTEKDSLDFLERTHKLVQDSPNVMKVTSTVVASRTPRSGTSVSEHIDRKLLDEVKQKLLSNTALAHDAITNIHMLEDEVEEDDGEGA